MDVEAPSQGFEKKLCKISSFFTILVIQIPPPTTCTPHHTHTHTPTHPAKSVSGHTNRHVNKQHNPRLTKRGGYHPLENFSLSPKNQKESDLSHLGDLSDILYSHFDEKQIERTTLSRARVSRQRPVG